MSENPVKTFPINTALFIDGKQERYIQNGRIKKLSDFIEEGKLG